MNKVSKMVAVAIMFLVILFASVSFATQEEADEIFKEILDEMTIGTINITRVGENPADSNVLPVPTVVIPKETIEWAIPSGWSYGFSKDEGAIILEDTDGNTYTQTLYIQNSTGYSMPPDTAVGNVEGLYVNTEGLAGVMAGNGISKKVIEMYENEAETGESISEDDYYCFTYSVFAVNQDSNQDIKVEDQASTNILGSKTNFVFNSSEDYDSTNFKLNSNASASITVEAGIDQDGNTHVIDTNKETPENIVQTPVTTIELASGEETNIIVDAESNESGRIYFTIAEPRIYYLQLYDESGIAVKMSQDMLFRAIGNNEERPQSYLSGGKLQVTLDANSQYYITTPEKGKSYRLNILAGTASVTGDPSIDAANIDDLSSSGTLFEAVEKLLSELCNGIAKTLNYLCSNALQQTVTLDDIIFNSYPETRLSFFKFDIYGEEVSTDDSPTSTINLLRDAITTWYKNFTAIALVGYMIILVYIGIKVLLVSTTPDALEKCKQTFNAWVVGILILAFFPYVMKYIIVLNDAMVKTIADSRTYKDIRTSSISSSEDQGLLYSNYDNVINFDGNDYMSSVGKLADEEKKLGFSIAYLILTWQLIMMVIYYYKRLIITAFLIIIFPLIALMYVWDKLNDGKSQSLSMWLREFSMSVFVQTFHAIVYVFVVDVIYANVNGDSYDFILLMIASSFLFAGENILKSIFGGGGEALGSAAQTAGKVSLITTAITQVGTRTISNVVSKDGFFRKGFRSMGEARKWGLLTKRDADGMRYIDKLATNEAAELRMNKILPAEGEITPTIRKAAEVVDTFNNLDKKKPEEIAKAREEYDRLMKKRNDGSMTPEERKQFDAIMRHSNINMNQLGRIDNAMTNAALAYSLAGDSKKARKKIMQNLQVEVEVIINSVDPNRTSAGNISKATNNVIRAGLMNMKKKGIDGIRRDDVVNTAREEIKNSKRVFNNINFAPASGGGAGASRSGRSADKANRAKSIAEQYKRTLNTKEIDTGTERMINQFAESLANFEDVGVNALDVNVAYDMVNSLPTSVEDKEMFNQMAKLANLQAEIDDLKYLIAKKAMTVTNVTPDMQNKFSVVASAMEAQAPHANIPAYTAEVNIGSKRNDVTIDPFVSIMDIINSCKDNGGNTSDFASMMSTVSEERVIEAMVDEKMVDIRSGNQARREEAKEFAEDVLKYFEKEAKDYKYEEATYMGYTASEATKMKHAAYADFLGNVDGLLADMVTMPAGIVIGSAIGAANTTDGMPLGEMAGGATAGARIATGFSDRVLPGLTDASAREKTKSSIKEKVQNRLDTNENDILKARNLFEDAQYASRGQADTYLTLDGFTANLIVDANNYLTAIIHVRAENAEYVCVNEQPGAGAWQSFQENISYTFRDNDYRKTHSLYVYVKDASGNVKNSVQYNLSV